jgi:hypothetical protein
VSEQKDVDAAQNAVMTAVGEDEQDAAIERLMEAVAGGDELTKQEAVNLVAAKTYKTKKEAQALREEQESERSRDLIEINHIEKIAPVGDGEEYRYRFHVSVGEEGGVVELSSGGLMTSHQFKRQIFELTNTVVQFNEWDQTLNQWMAGSEIIEREEDPISTDHALAEAVIDRMRAMEIVSDAESFRMRPLHACRYVPEGNLLLVAGKLIDDVKGDLKGEVSMRRASEILGPLLADNTKTVRINDNHLRVWQFDADAIATSTDIELDRTKPEEET